MKALRPFLWAAILVAGFFYITSLDRWDAGRMLRGAGRMWVASPSMSRAQTSSPSMAGFQTTSTLTH